jgi:TatD DNase family protein
VPFVDTHCHLNFEPLCDDLDGVLQRATSRGVNDIIVPAYDSASWTVVERLGRLNGIHPALGLHPWVASEPLDSEELKRRLGALRAVAVGEIGLDSKVEVPIPRQMDVFEQQLDLAAALAIPVILHCRGAFDELVGALKARPGLSGVIHAFSRGPELARRFLDLGLYIGIGGAVTRPRASRARQAARMIPEDRLLLETDAPSIGLDGVAPEDTEPAHIRNIASALAGIRAQSVDDIAAATTKNAKRLFGIKQRF